MALRRGDRARRHGVVALLVVALVGAACSVSIGSSRYFDPRETETEIIDRLGDDLGVAIDDAQCPGRVEIGVGVTFECTMVVSGHPVPVVVTQTDEAGDLDFETRGVVVTAKLVEVVVGAFAYAGQTVTAECGLAPLRFVSAGDTIECRATHPDGRVVTVVATVTDDSGRVTLSPVGAADQPANPTQARAASVSRSAARSPDSERV